MSSMSVYVIEVNKIYEIILLFFNCVMSVPVFYLLLAVPWVGLRSDIGGISWSYSRSFRGNQIH